jgi:hypothetical protein
MNKQPTYTVHDGFPMPKGFPIDGFISGLQYQAQPSDLFICTYPKCGTTLCQHLVYLMLNNGVPIQPEEKLDQMFPHLEEVGKDHIQNKAVVRNGSRLIKTHLPYDMTPSSKRARYIFIARNPKDCVVSFFHHTRGFPKHYNFADGDFDVYFDLFMEGKVDFGSYFETLRSWIDHRDDDHVLFLTYEEIRSDKRGCILKMAKFIDTHGGVRNDDDCISTTTIESKLLENDEELMKKVIFHSSLESMKKDPLRWCSERPEQFTPFIRNGNVGMWNELLTDKQALALDEKMREVFSTKELEILGNKYGKET